MKKIGSYMPLTVSGPATIGLQLFRFHLLSKSITHCLMFILIFIFRLCFTMIGGIMLKINEIGPLPLVSIYFDLSYGRKPQPMLIIDSSLESSPVLQNLIRWNAPKSAPFNIRYDVPPLLGNLIDLFLPTTLDIDKRQYERESITNFIRELNQLRRESLRREFSDSYVLYNVSMLTVTYPFVSFINRRKTKTSVWHCFTHSIIDYLINKLFLFSVVLGEFDNTVKLVWSDTCTKR